MQISADLLEQLGHTSPVCQRGASPPQLADGHAEAEGDNHDHHTSRDVYYYY